VFERAKSLAGAVPRRHIRTQKTSEPLVNQLNQTELIENKASRFNNTAKKDKEADSSIDYSLNVASRYLDTHKKHLEARKIFNEKFNCKKLQDRETTKVLGSQAIKPKSLLVSATKPTKVTTLLSSKKGNLMRELTVEDVYEVEN
jgi:hypothetical protein